MWEKGKKTIEWSLKSVLGQERREKKKEKRTEKTEIRRGSQIKDKERFLNTVICAGVSCRERE